MIRTEDKGDFCELQDLQIVVAQCHFRPFCVHLIQEKDEFYYDDSEIILNREEVQSIVDAFPTLNAVKETKEPYRGKYSFINGQLKTGWSFGETLDLGVNYFFNLVQFELVRRNKNGFTTSLFINKRSLRDLHKIFQKLLAQFS